MSQTITVKIKLTPTKEEEELLKSSSLSYIQTINVLVSEMIKEEKPTKKTSKDVVAPLNSAVKNQAIRDAKSVFMKAKKTKFSTIPILRKPVIIWNNQNFSVDASTISMPFIVEEKSKKIAIRALVQERDLDLMKRAIKVGTLRITQKNHKWIAQISLEIPVQISFSASVMGIDLGIKVPAVCKTDSGKVKFAGNGHQNKYVRRKFKAFRKKMGKAKKVNAIKKMDDKEQRWMKDQDHKISRSIVNFAKENKMGTIRLEELTNIRKTTRKSRKNNHNIHNWSFYRLAHFIEYKANLAGIKVEYVNPAYTSQACPQCNERNKAKDRRYVCSKCGYECHRDLVGASNIIYAPVLSGNS